MNVYYNILLVFCLCMGSCSEQKLSRKNRQENTPKALNNNKIYFSKKRGRDIISELYQEALEKNPTLQKLQENIEQLHQMQTDSLQDYREYRQNNRHYWEATQNYLHQLNDSVLRKSTQRLFEKLEVTYLKNIAAQEAKLQKIEQLSSVLNDQQIVLKLLVTEKMMNDYQVNEKPDSTPLAILIQKYGALIQELKELNTNQK